MKISIIKIIYKKGYIVYSTVFPMVGTTIGVPTDYRNKTKKPRVSVDSFAFYGNYDKEKVEKGVDIQEEDMKNWKISEELPQLLTYKEMIVRIYGELRYKDVNKVMEKQGFKFTDNPNEK